MPLVWALAGASTGAMASKLSCRHCGISLEGSPLTCPYCGSFTGSLGVSGSTLAKMAIAISVPVVGDIRVGGARATNRRVKVGFSPESHTVG